MSNKWTNDSSSTDSSVDSYASLSDNDYNNNNNSNASNSNNGNKGSGNNGNSSSNNNNNSNDNNNNNNKGPSKNGDPASDNNKGNEDTTATKTTTNTTTPTASTMMMSQKKKVKSACRTKSSNESVVSKKDSKCSPSASSSGTARPPATHHRRHQCQRTSSRNISQSGAACTSTSGTSGGSSSHCSYSSLIETKSTNSLNSIRVDGTKRESQVESSDIEIRNSSKISNKSAAAGQGKAKSSKSRQKRPASKTSSLAMDEYSSESINDEMDDYATSMTIHEPTVQLVPATKHTSTHTPHTPPPPTPPALKPPPTTKPIQPKHHKQFKLRTKSKSKLAKSKGFSLKVISGGTGAASTSTSTSTSTSNSGSGKTRGRSAQKLTKTGKNKTTGRQTLQEKSNDLKMKTHRVKSKSKSVKPKSCSLKLKKKGNALYGVHGEIKSARGTASAGGGASSNKTKQIKSRDGHKLSPTPTQMGVGKFYSELPKPKAMMRPLTSERIKQFSTPNFLNKYRTAVKEMKVKEMKRKTFSTKTLTTAMAAATTAAATTAAAAATAATPPSAATTTPMPITSLSGNVVGEKANISATAVPQPPTSTPSTNELDLRPENKAQHKITKLIMTNSALVQNLPELAAVLKAVEQQQQQQQIPTSRSQSLNAKSQRADQQVNKSLQEGKSVQIAASLIGNSIVGSGVGSMVGEMKTQRTPMTKEGEFTKVPKQLKTDQETAKLMEKLYSNWECYESLMIKFKIMKEQDSKGHSTASLVQQFKDGAAELSARLFNSIVVPGADGGTSANTATAEQQSVKDPGLKDAVVGGVTTTPATGAIGAAPKSTIQPSAAGATPGAAAADGAAAAVPDKPFTNDEMEDLNDELTDLNTSVNTLKHSYGSIIRSLVNMQNRRAKKGAAKNALAPVTNSADADSSAANQPPKRDLNIGSVVDRFDVNYSERYSLERFLDENTRDEVFNRLFLEVTEINTSMLRFRALFDNEGYYQPLLYAEGDFKISRREYSACIKVIKDISKVVAQILKAYNTDLLDMFRINSSVT